MSFKKTYSRTFTLGKLASCLIGWLLHKISKFHLGNNRKQLAVFAFDHIAHSINIHGIYEKEELNTFFNWLSQANISFQEKIAIDIGANIGNHSLYFSDYFQFVHGFEPNPRTFKVLSINSELAENVICHKVGLSDLCRNAQIKPNVGGNIGNSQIVDCSAPNTVSIDLKKLDSYNFINVGLIKIDIEGHEYNALLGSKKTIIDNKPIILFEQHFNDFLGNTSPVIELIRSFGYDKFAIIQRSPSISRTIIGNSVFNIILRLIFSERISVKIIHNFSPGFYSFIIALPDWLESKDL